MGSAQDCRDVRFNCTVHDMNLLIHCIAKFVSNLAALSDSSAKIMCTDSTQQLQQHDHGRTFPH